MTLLDEEVYEILFWYIGRSIPQQLNKYFGANKWGYGNDPLPRLGTKEWSSRQIRPTSPLMEATDAWGAVSKDLVKSPLNMKTIHTGLDWVVILFMGQSSNQLLPPRYIDKVLVLHTFFLRIPPPSRSPHLVAPLQRAYKWGLGSHVMFVLIWAIGPWFSVYPSSTSNIIFQDVNSQVAHLMNVGS